MNVKDKPCTGACCERKETCRHYQKHLENKKSGKVEICYIGDGNPSRCYLNSFDSYRKVELPNQVKEG